MSPTGVLAELGEFLVQSDAMEKVYEHYADDLPNECVGLTWGDGKITRLINQARSHERFTVSISQMARALTSRDGIILCIYHSHPAGTTGLSIDDQRSMREEWSNGYFIPWLVVTETTAMLWVVDRSGEFVSHKLDLLPLLDKRIERLEAFRNGLVHA